MGRAPTIRPLLRALPSVGRARPLLSAAESLLALAAASEPLSTWAPSGLAQPLLTLAAASEPLTAWDPSGVARWGWWGLIAWLFAAQAKVCDGYFVPAIEACSRRFSIPEDVAGATLMAFGCNGPELFVNGIAIFVTHSDVGVGTVVGSEIFNLLCIIGGATLVAPIAPLPVDRASFARDCAFYALAAGLLGAVVLDGKVERAEALGLVGMAAVYALAVSQTAGALERAGFRRCVAPAASGAEGGAGAPPDESCTVLCGVTVSAEAAARTKFVCTDEGGPSTPPSGLRAAAGAVLGLGGRFLELSLAPLEGALRLTVSDCSAATAQSDARWLPAFLASMAWLAACSLGVCLAAEQLSASFGIPSAVLGLTVAAAGTSFANLASSLIEARRGKVGMAVANALGSNVQNVFIALGVPWLAYSLASGGQPLLVGAGGIGEGVGFMLGSLAAFIAATVAADFTVSRGLAKGALLAYGGYLAYTCGPLLLAP